MTLVFFTHFYAYYDSIGSLMLSGSKHSIRILVARHTWAAVASPTSGDAGMHEKTEFLPPVLPRDVPDFHERQASHCRALADSADSPAVKERLLREAEEYEKIACADMRDAPEEEMR